MTTVDQFLKALAVVESSDDPEAWGDCGHAMGRWQIHPSRLWSELHGYTITPTISETWDQLVARILIATFNKFSATSSPARIAMYWHLGHWTSSDEPDWDAKYAARFGAALLNAQEDLL